MQRDFDKWLDEFKDSISSYKYYVDFEKVINNVGNIKVELNILNSLIGDNDIENSFEKIISKYPETLKCVPILLAVRKYKIFAMDIDGEFEFDFKNQNYSINEYKMFMRKTGLFDMISKHLVNNLVDYVYGVETGLDSNGRKNRGGHQMEDVVENYLSQIDDLEYYKELKLSKIEAKWNIDLGNISNSGKSEKRFDFVVKTKDTIYAIETNFYAGGGSKLNETARSYKMIAQESSEISGFEFIWITDGKGWRSAKNNLQETFDMMEHIYNIKDLADGKLVTLFN